MFQANLSQGSISRHAAVLTEILHRPAQWRPLSWGTRFLLRPARKVPSSSAWSYQQADGPASSRRPCLRSCSVLESPLAKMCTAWGGQLLATGTGKAVQTAAVPAHADLENTLGAQRRGLRPGSPVTTIGHLLGRVPGRPRELGVLEDELRKPDPKALWL